MCRGALVESFPSSAMRAQELSLGYQVCFEIEFYFVASAGLELIDICLSLPSECRN